MEDGLRQRSRGRRRRRGLTDMALYEYQCKKCRRKTEVIQRFSDPPPTECPHCGGALAKLLSSPAVQFKGSGFYVTDYGRSGAKLENHSREKEGDSSKGKEGDSKEKDSSKGKEGSGGSPGDAGAGTKGDSEGGSSKEKKDSGRGAASDGSAAKASTAPDSASRKNTKRR